MFTGIVERTAKVLKIEQEKSNFHITIETPIAKEMTIDQSVSHDGVCLTTVKVDKEKSQYIVTAIQETMDKTNIGTWNVGYEVNLERCLPVNGRFDGHIVQGHVDTTAICTKVEETDGSWKFWFTYEKGRENITVPKGSVSVNGVSLTVVDSDDDAFSVAIIPFTYDMTNFHNFKPGTKVNLEFDVIGKYIAKIMQQYFDEKKI
jgi:riboflavin synthase